MSATTGSYGSTVTTVTEQPPQQQLRSRSRSPNADRARSNVPLLVKPPVAGSGERKISWTEAYVQMVKGNMGPGCLALPYAFSHGGLIESPIVFVIVVAMVMYAMVSLLKCKEDLSHTHPKLNTYGDVGQAVMGRHGRHTIDFFLGILQAGVCCVQIDFVSNTMAAMLPGTSQRMLTLAILPAFLSVSLVLSLKRLAPLMVIALTAMVVAITVVINHGIDAIAEGHEPLISSLPYYQLVNLPVLFGAILYSIEGIGIVLPIQDQMQDPAYGRSVVLCGMSTVAFIFLLIAMVCCTAFGVIRSGSITAELERRGGSIAVMLVNVMLCFATLLSYPLQLLPAAQVVEDYLGLNTNQYQPLSQSEGLPPLHISNHGKLRRCIRLALTAICGGLAVMLADNLALTISAVGSLAGAVLGLVIPATLNIILWNDGGIKQSSLMLGVNISLVCFGVLGAVIGTGSSVIDMVDPQYAGRH